MTDRLTDAERDRWRRRQHRWRDADTGPLVFLFLTLCAVLLGGYAACSGGEAIARAYVPDAPPQVCDEPLLAPGEVPDMPRCPETFGPYRCYLDAAHELPHRVDLSEPHWRTP